MVGVFFSACGLLSASRMQFDCSVIVLLLLIYVNILHVFLFIVNTQIWHISTPKTLSFWSRFQYKMQKVQ